MLLTAHHSDCELLDSAPEAVTSAAAAAAQVPDGSDGQTADLHAGDMMVIKYTTVQHLVEAGRAALL